ncbi:MAG: Gfo/Idh/MocA family oxidoreductase, partial [Acidobacteria bacterium]|nr:Gfo/Idh/MocA family oxidoreductase [Acidobacteriota bacterium]
MNTPADTPLKAAVVGTGHLGRHHVRILSQRSDINFLGAFDTNAEQLAAITGEHGVQALPSIESVREADLVVVATPTISHREVAGDLLAAGCHVMVEKPITSTVAEAEELIALADANDRVLAVGHVEFH